MTTNKKAMIPGLRFSGFKGNWEIEPLGKLFNNRQEKGDENLPLLSLTAEAGIVPQAESGRKDSSNADKSRYLKVLKGDIAYNTMRMWEGRSALSSLEGLVSPAYTVCAPKKDADSTFFSYYIKTPNLIEQFNRNSQGLTKDTYCLKYPSFAKIRVPLPTVEEQQKIADCLGSLDDLIAAHRRKLDVLQDHKKGLLQQLFPAEGEATPKLRFPGFEGEWEEKKIADLEPYVTSGSRGWAAYYSDSGDLFVRITNLSRSSIYLDLENSKYVKLPEGSNEGVRTRLKEHDILISITADIGIIGYVGASDPSPAYINQHIALVRFDQSKASGKFVSYFLSSERAQRNFRGSTDSGTKSGMNLNGIKSIKLLLPSINEQIKIADCLSALDALITAQTKQINALKEHKKGLMQKLFPNLN